jgi:DnaJ-class molecular chaperone
MMATDPAKPGDEAPPGVPGTGENLCARCGGTGKLGRDKLEGNQPGAEPCPDCNGTGKVTTGIGGG